MCKAVLGLLVLAASAALCLGCDDAPKSAAAPEQAPAEQSTTAPAPASAASVRVSADKTHAVQPGDEITVSVEVTGFTLDGSLMGQSNQEGVGHYSVHLDDTGKAPLVVSAERSVKVTIPQDITDGSHDVLVVLKNNDRTPLAPPVQGSVLLIVYRL